MASGTEVGDSLCSDTDASWLAEVGVRGCQGGRVRNEALQTNRGTWVA